MARSRTPARHHHTTGNAACKHLQRRLYTAIMNDRRLVLLLFLTLAALQLYFFKTSPVSITAATDTQLRGTDRGTQDGSHRCTYTDNIAGIDFSDRMCIEPIDIVYTWVNGSELEWATIKNIYKEEYLQQMKHPSMSTRRNSSTSIDRNMAASNVSSSSTANTTTTTNTTSSNTSSTPSPSSQPTEQPSVGSDNRYRDNEELRYSLRSIFRFAPWVRRIYIVTANQVPSWINMDHPRLHMVNHDEIFANPNDLPTFSSPAIESNLHRIPGLSKRFIYFNDDVMLGAPTWPEDFHSPSTGQKVYLSWDVPKCSEGCSDAWIGDKQCDLACNNSRCLWDLNDCENTTSSSTNTGSHSSNSHRRTQTFYCSSGCALNWVGDKVCDSKCENVECAWDGGDCGMQQMWDGSVYGIEAWPIESNGWWNGESSTGTGTGTGMSLGTTEIATPTSSELPLPWHTATTNFTNTTAAQEHHDAAEPSIEEQTAALIRQIRQNNAPIDERRALPQPTVAPPTLPTPPTPPKPFVPIYYVPSGQPSLYINMSSIFPALPVGGSTISKSTHDGPNVIGNAIVLQHHKVMVLLFQVDDDAKKRGRTVTNIMVEGATIEEEITDANGTVVNTTSKAVSIEFEISTNAAGKDDVTVFGHFKPNSMGQQEVRTNAQDRVTIHVRNATNTNHTTTKPGDKTNGTHGGVFGDAIARVEDPVARNEGGTVVYLPSDLSAGVVRLRNSSNPLPPTATPMGPKRRLLGLRSTAATAATAATTASTDRSRPQPRRRRRLLDIYGDSLVNVNMMYHSRFGKMARKVPAHMPHMIDIDVMSELWTEYPTQFAKTSGRRFRGGEDMQFSFAHFYWLIHKIPDHDLQNIWEHDLDVDGDGKLNVNELRSLTAIVEGKAPDDSAIQEITKCLRPAKTEDLTEETEFGTVQMKRTIFPHATFGQFMECARVVQGVQKNWKRSAPTHTIMPLDEVTFEMVGDDYNVTKEQLDGIRAKRTKFICVNDDMHHPSKELQEMLHQFYQALFFKPSPFELPQGEINPYLNTDKMREFRSRKGGEIGQWAKMGVLVGVGVVLWRFFNKVK